MSYTGCDTNRITGSVCHKNRSCVHSSTGIEGAGCHGLGLFSPGSDIVPFNLDTVLGKFLLHHLIMLHHDVLEIERCFYVSNVNFLHVSCTDTCAKTKSE